MFIKRMYLASSIGFNIFLNYLQKSYWMCADQQDENEQLKWLYKC